MGCLLQTHIAGASRRHHDAELVTAEDSGF